MSGSYLDHYPNFNSQIRFLQSAKYLHHCCSDLSQPQIGLCMSNVRKITANFRGHSDFAKKVAKPGFFQKTFEKANERYTFQSIRLFYYSKCFLSILIAPRSLIKFHSAKVNWCEMDLRSQINAGISLDLC